MKTIKNLTLIVATAVLLIACAAGGGGAGGDNNDRVLNFNIIPDETGVTISWKNPPRSDIEEINISWVAYRKEVTQAVTTRTQSSATSTQAVAIANQVVGVLADNMTTSGDGNMTTSGDGNMTTSGDGNMTTSGDGNMTTSGDGNMTTSGDGNMTTSGDGNMTTSGDGDMTESGDGDNVVPEPIDARYSAGDGFLIINSTVAIATATGNNYRIDTGQRNVSGLLINGSPLNASHSYIFSIQLSFTSNAGPIKRPDIPRPALPRAFGANLDGDSLSDSQDNDDDNDNILDVNDNCPVLANTNQLDTDNDRAGDVCDVDVNGNGLIDIRTVADLNLVRANLTSESFAGDSNGCGGGRTGDASACNGYELLAHIDLNDLSDADNNNNVNSVRPANWEGIGNCGLGDDCDETTSAELFNGIFEGNNYNISNMYIQVIEDSYGVGFFGAVAPGAEIRNVNLHLVDISVSEGITATHVGGLIGSGDGAIISRSNVILGDVRGSDFVGGLIGYAKDTRISNSSVTLGLLEGIGNVGGLAAFADDARITAVAVIIENIIQQEISLGFGGLVASGNRATIEFSSVIAGTISGEYLNIGGLVGAGEDVTINVGVVIIGEIIGTAENVGGLIGSAQNARISSSLVRVDKFSGSTGIGGLVGVADGASRVIESYVVARIINASAVSSSAGGLVGRGATLDRVSSYWDSSVVIVANSKNVLSTNTNFENEQLSVALQEPTTREGSIYTLWNAACNPETKEYNAVIPDPANGFIEVWDFGTDREYPALNCLSISVAEQRSIDITSLINDGDGDGTKDYFDIDDDNDNIFDDEDNCQFIPNEDQLDANNDGEGDVCDINSNSDGDDLFDNMDNCPLVSNEEQINSDSDAQGDACDPDDDNDRILDAADNCPLYFNRDQSDFDNDNVGDACDTDSDRDNDNIFDAFDVDDNGNGLIDIRTAAELSLMRANLTGESFAGDTTGCGGSIDANGAEISSCNGYELLADINLNDLHDGSSESLANWNSIGSCGTNIGCDSDSGAKFFSTIFAGNNYTISNMTIHITEDTYGVGLLGAVAAGAQLKNINIDKFAISVAPSITAERFGSLVGYGEDAIINGSSAVVEQFGEGLHTVGGLIGFANNMTITRSVANINGLNGTSAVGGLVGTADSSLINSSSVTVTDISGTGSVGGLVGTGAGTRIIYSDTTIANISGTGSVGGLVGTVAGTSIIYSDTTIANISGTGSVGGLVGNGTSSTITSSNTTLAKLSGTGSVGGLVGNADSALINSSLVTVTDISGTGAIGGLVGKADSALIKSSLVTVTDISGTGAIGGLVGKADSTTIVLSSVTLEELAAAGSIGGLVGSGMMSNINSSSVTAFIITGTADHIGGLIGDARGTRIYNVSVDAVDINGNAAIGGLVGFGNSLTRINYSVARINRIANAGTATGGLVGSGGGTKISLSVVIATSITGSKVNSGIGGLVGYGEGSSIDGSAARVFVFRGIGTIGGLVGFGFSAKVSNSYMITSEIEGTGGGIAGFENINNVGGLVGTGNNAGLIKNSYVIMSRFRGNAPGRILSGARTTDVSPSRIINSYGADISAPNAGLSKQPTRQDNELRGTVEFNNSRTFTGWDATSCDAGADIFVDMPNIGNSTLWDLGTDSQYPALNCLPLTLDEQWDLTFAELYSNRDGDRINDYFDTDVDGDNVANVEDNCLITFNPDQANENDDAEGDACDTDVDFDGDGLVGHADNCIRVANPDQVNTDRDPFGNVCDPDDDNDLVLDADDNCPLASNPGQENNYGGPNDAGDACDDTDNDQVLDSRDNCPVDRNTNQLDDNRNGVGNACETDFDNDGVINTRDNCPMIANPGQANNYGGRDNEGDACDDTDTDGVLDISDNCPVIQNTVQTDFDDDGIGDACEIDFDDDGVLSITDNCPMIANPLQEDNYVGDGNKGDACGDVDNDTLFDLVDNCPTTKNTLQLNADEDSEGDVCDPDDDNDGVLDFATDGFTPMDNCRFTDNVNQSDTDNDNFGDVCDIDNNGNGLIDINTIEKLNLLRANLTGESLAGDSAGCGGNRSGDASSCSGYELLANMDLNDLSDNFNDSNWESIGNCGSGGACNEATGAKLFNTRFISNNYIISNMRIHVTENSYGVGFFGAVASGAELTNIRIDNASISVAPSIIASRVGALVGYGTDVIILNSAVNGVAISGSNIVGGLIGGGRGVIINSSSALFEKLSGTKEVGGLIGQGVDVQISSSIATFGDIISSGNVAGGLIGNANNGASVIYSSAALIGNIRASNNVGGLIGLAFGSRIISSFSMVDEVTATGDIASGMVGRDIKMVEIIKSYTATNSINTPRHAGAMIAFAGGVTIGDSSYWDNKLTTVVAGNNGLSNPLSTSELQTPNSPDGIYSEWANAYCNPTTGAYADSMAVDFIQAWDFGNSTDYPALNCLHITPTEQRAIMIEVLARDTDGDGTADYFDTDDDGDGIADSNDNCQFEANPDQVNSNSAEDSEGDACDIDSDFDNDNNVDAEDNCIMVANPDQINTDGDEFGDACDSDSDNDQVPDFATDGFTPRDNCRFVANTDQTNEDNDNFGAMCDVDDNGNGLIDISTAEELNLVRNNLTGESLDGNVVGCGNVDAMQCNGYELLADIDLNDLPADTNAANWQSIGTCGSGTACDELTGAQFFATTFDGNDYTISNMRIHITANSYGVGLFGAVASGEQLNNILIRDAKISVAPGITASRVGVLLGHGAGVVINSSSANAIAINGEDDIGGLVGYAPNAAISSSSANAMAINGEDDIGGLVGYAPNAAISGSSANAMAINGEDHVGGLVGYAPNAVISSSLASAREINGMNNVGGLVGNATSLAVSSSLAAVNEINGMNNVAGLVGNGQEIQIQSSYAAVREINGASNVGGLVGDGTAGTMTYSYVVALELTSTGEIAPNPLVGTGTSTIVNSYWDINRAVFSPANPSTINGITTFALQVSRSGVGASPHYPNWVNIFCNPTTGEHRASSATDFIQAWDFGSSGQYPVLACLRNAPAEQRLLVVEALDIDTDGDGIRDGLDLDDDNDLVFDTSDNCQLIANFGQENTYGGPDDDGDACDDTDNDGSFDAVDNCPVVVNINQLNNDQDMMGDACDTDDDNDGPLDTVDNCPFTENTDQNDEDNDTLGDSCDVDADGNGWIDIRTAADLNLVRNNLTGESLDGNVVGCGGSKDSENNTIDSCSGYELQAHIDLNDLNADPSAANWVSIGNCGHGAACSAGTRAQFFATNFNGNHYNISNMRIHVTTNSYGVGLFGAVAPGMQLTNIILHDASIVKSGVTASRVGALLGSGDNVIISNSVVIHGSVAGSADVGGLVGRAARATITSSSVVIESVTGTGNNVGGLVGFGDSAIIRNSLVINANGSVAGSASVGGLVGRALVATITSSSVAIESVAGTGRNVGGLVGEGVSLANAPRIKIRASSAIVKTVSSNGNRVGGLVGDGANADIRSSSATIGRISGGDLLGGLIGSSIASRIASSLAIVTGYNTGGRVGALVSNTLATSISSTYHTNHGGKSVSEIQTPVGFSGIYAPWAAHYCNPTTGAYRTTSAEDFIPAWDLGTASEYPVLACLNDFFPLADQRAAMDRVILGL